MKNAALSLFNYLLLVLCTTSLVSAETDESKQIKDGFGTLGERYGSPTLKIWLDRPGDDLRAHFEGRVNPPWWSAANAVEAMIDLMNATGGNDYDAWLTSLHDLHRNPMAKWPLLVNELKRRGGWSAEDEKMLKRKQPKSADDSEFRNEYLDDSGWWGIAWLKMAERTKEKKFLTTAKAIHAHMAKAWRPDLGGGVLWCLEPDKQKPNTITNNLFLILSARLASYTGEDSYMQWSTKAHAWIQEQKLYDGTAVVDAPGHQQDYWSYNQGTYLGALLAYAELTKDAAALANAAGVASRLVEHAGFVNDAGILQERLGTNGWDGCLFKGIFARYLGQMRDELVKRKVHPEVATELTKTLNATAAALRHFQANDSGQFPADWHSAGKNQERNFNTDLSGLIALVAALPTSATPSAKD
jgi:predicted alpha-1,6-mannanase (GH76 family)